ncbi:MAG: transposase [Candidatus Peribacteraceae bacterium]|nr:transposase [Candidatus Peribacteraceae bacterium]MDP7454045.1 transposase [Candidatus Peribacteraceae bacterium]|tara:strand:- start:248 stop:682 length:435 start_codon:yes stop_codon:yes gene_type:complete
MTQRHETQNEFTMFVTTNTYKRNPFFLNDSHAHEAIEQIYRVQERMPFILYGFVIMPDHCHFLLNVPEPGSVSSVIRMYKMGLSFQIGISPLWQKRFYNKVINNTAKTLRYIHNNPVKAGICENQDKYKWSSASGKWDITPLSW